MSTIRKIKHFLRCKEVDELKKLKEENEELKRQIEEIKLSYNIFFWAVITLMIFGIKIIIGG